MEEDEKVAVALQQSNDEEETEEEEEEEEENAVPLMADVIDEQEVLILMFGETTDFQTYADKLNTIESIEEVFHIMDKQCDRETCMKQFLSDKLKVMKTEQKTVLDAIKKKQKKEEKARLTSDAQQKVIRVTVHFGAETHDVTLKSALTLKGVRFMLMTNFPHYFTSETFAKTLTYTINGRDSTMNMNPSSTSEEQGGTTKEQGGTTKEQGGASKEQGGTFDKFI
ncbi:unnamed protein product [Effrenium voratum]|nr:unnamed protein product [Effrenium voratum]